MRGRWSIRMGYRLGSFTHRESLRERGYGCLYQISINDLFICVGYPSFTQLLNTFTQSFERHDYRMLNATHYDQVFLHP
jgi:hypothetical protein